MGDAWRICRWLGFRRGVGSPERGLGRGLVPSPEKKNCSLDLACFCEFRWVFFENLTEGQFASASPAPNSWGLLPPVSVIYMHAKSLRTPQVGVGNVLPMSVCLSVSRMTQHVMCGLS